MSQIQNKGEEINNNKKDKLFMAELKRAPPADVMQENSVIGFKKEMDEYI